VYAFQLSADGKLTPLNNQPVAGDGACHPCYLAVAPGTGEVLSASYVSAHVHAFPVHDDGCLGPGRTTKLPPAAPEVTYPGPVAERQEGPHAHCYEPMGDGTFGLVCDLGSDELLVLRTSDGSLVSRAAFPAGSGPRHVAITADLSRVYVSTELSNTLQTVPIDATTGKLGTPIGASLLPTDYTGPPTTASHIELSPCGGFAYVANRVGVDKDGGCSAAAEGSISVLKVGSEAAELVEVVEIGGKVPRGFCVVSAGAQGGGWLVVGAQESSILRTFAVQPSSGRLKRTEHELAIPSPGCVVAV
jgi:6-phosphogluconolactonase